MILTLDVGNSNIKNGIFDKDKLVHSFSLVTDVKQSVDDYRVAFEQMIPLKGNLDLGDIEGIVISSVVPTITERLISSLSFLKVKTLLVGDSKVDTGVVAKIDKPTELGSDIISNIVAAKEKFKENFIVIDMGTATTIMACGGNGDLIGGVIAPGCNLLIPALSNACCLLPDFKMEIAERTLCKNTREAMNSGAYFGFMGLVKELVQRLKEESDLSNVKICATGGISKIFINEMSFIDEVIPFLTLQGLNIIWKINNK